MADYDHSLAGPDLGVTQADLPVTVAQDAAGAHTALIIGDNPAPDYANQADHVIRRLREVLTICELPSGT